MTDRTGRHDAAMGQDLAGEGQEGMRKETEHGHPRH